MVRHLQKGLNVNLSEYIFQTKALEMGIEIQRRGYPDFSVIKNNKIVAFIEIKPTGKKLRKHQEMFKDLCEENGIPFFTWSPDMEFPQI